jgi:uncharacterized membrane protein
MLRGIVMVVLLANSLAAGIMVSTVMGTVPMTRILPYSEYVRMIQFLWKRYDPFMPIMNGLSLLGDLILVRIAPQRSARDLFGAAAVCLAVAMAISVLKNVPINRYVMSLDPANEPADWQRTDPRRRWQAWNRFRTGLTFAALSAATVATVSLLA